MLERIALHQTRLRTPGLGLDAKGIALGAKGLVLFPSLDRLVAFLAVYTKERSLEDLTPSLSLGVVRSRLGMHETLIEVSAESSDRMDRVAETARLVGGFTFTGTSRHFVQYRDAAAPFGYDVAELLSTPAPLVFYHDTFTQVYERERAIDLRELLLRLMLHGDPASSNEPGPRVLLAEPGLGPALVHYLIRSRVDGELCVAEWPPESAFDAGPRRRTLLRIPDLPERMRPLFLTTPGITMFRPVGPGVAVEVGYRHPIELRACPVFDPAGLVLFRGGGAEPWIVDRLPQMGALRAFARVEIRGPVSPVTALPREPDASAEVSVPLRLVPSTVSWRNVTATWIPKDKAGLLRTLAYSLSRDVLGKLTLASTPLGIFVRSSGGIEALPIGVYFVEIHPGLYLPAGYEISPQVAPEVLHRAVGAGEHHVTFLTPDARTHAIPADSFVPMDVAVVQAPKLHALEAERLRRSLSERPIELKLAPVGLFPLWGMGSSEEGGPDDGGDPSTQGNG